MKRRVAISAFDTRARMVQNELRNCGYEVRDGGEFGPLDIFVFTLGDNIRLPWGEGKTVKISPALQDLCPIFADQNKMLIAIRPDELNLKSVIVAVQLYERWLIKQIGVPWNATHDEGRLKREDKAWRDEMLPLIDGTEWERTPRLPIDAPGLTVRIGRGIGAWGNWGR